MTTPAANPPAPTRIGRPAYAPIDRDERRVRAILDALNPAIGPIGAVDSERRTDALRALLDCDDIAAQPEWPRTTHVDLG